MNIVLTMTLSSSILFLLYVIINYFDHTIFSPRLKYSILKTALLFSFIPLAYIKPVIHSLTSGMNPVFSDRAINGQMQILMVTPEGRYANTAYSINSVVICIWLSMSALVILLCVKKYMNCRYSILRTSREQTKHDTLSILQKYRSVLKIKREIRIYESQADISPFTFGIVHPIIVIPARLDSCMQELVLYHELCHIKRFDCLVKFLQLLNVGIFWFNPLVYILDSYLDDICEQSCDEIVTRNMTHEQRKQYGHLIVELASTAGMWTTHIIPFSDSKNSVRERILMIMTPKRKHTKSVLFLTLGMVMFSCLPVFAYQEPAVVVWENQPSKDILHQDTNQTLVFSEQNKEHTFFPSSNTVLYEEQFVDQEGSIYPIESEQRSARIKCKEHTYVDGTYQKHVKNKNGSCITKSYNCQKCKKCGTLKTGSLINENQYTKCPH